MCFSFANKCVSQKGQILIPKAIRERHNVIPGSKVQILEQVEGILIQPAPEDLIDAANLKELLGFGSYGTAWCWLQKLRRCTIRQDRKKLSGRVEVDEFFIGAKKSGKRGRGADGKTIVAIAVER